MFLPATTKASFLLGFCASVPRKLRDMPSGPQGSEPGPRLAGVIFVSAPVFGRPDAAMEHRVTFAVAGPPKTKEQLQPLLKSMSRGILDLGEQPELANVMKITGDSNRLKRWTTLQGRRGSGREGNASKPEQHAGLHMLQWLWARLEGYHRNCLA